MESGAIRHEFDDNDRGPVSPIRVFFLNAIDDSIIKPGIAIGAPLIVCLLIWASPLQAAQLIIPEITGNPGEMIHNPVIVKDVDNLAGLKLTTSFDSTLRNYQDTITSSHDGALMRLVNAGTPCRLTIGMARAAGIGDRNIPVLMMGFKIYHKSNH